MSIAAGCTVERTVIVLLPQRPHGPFEGGIQGSSDRVYRARRGPATWLIAGAARGVGAGSPFMLLLMLLLLRERELALGYVGR